MMTTAERDTARGGPPRAWGGWLLAAAGVVLLAGYLLFCHGCHGDVDDELFAPANRGTACPGVAAFVVRGQR